MLFHPNNAVRAVVELLQQWNYKYTVKDKFPGGPVARTHASSPGDPGLILGQGARSYMMQLKIPQATT